MKIQKTRAEKRDVTKRKRMRVHGARTRALPRLIAEKAKRSSSMMHTYERYTVL